jgi:hypothetical protein
VARVDLGSGLLVGSVGYLTLDKDCVDRNEFSRKESETFALDLTKTLFIVVRHDYEGIDNHHLSNKVASW